MPPIMGTGSNMMIMIGLVELATFCRTNAARARHEHPLRKATAVHGFEHMRKDSTTWRRSRSAKLRLLHTERIHRGTFARPGALAALALPQSDPGLMRSG